MRQLYQIVPQSLDGLHWSCWDAAGPMCVYAESHNLSAVAEEPQIGPLMTRRRTQCDAFGKSKATRADHSLLCSSQDTFRHVFPSHSLVYFSPVFSSAFGATKRRSQVKSNRQDSSNEITNIMPFHDGIQFSNTVYFPAWPSNCTRFKFTQHADLYTSPTDIYVIRRFDST